MNITYVRSSSINTYKDCEAKFFYEYCLNIPSKAGKKALLGSLIHHILEIIGRAKKTGHYKLNDKYIDPEYLLEICWNRYTNEEHGKTFKFTKGDRKFCLNSVLDVLQHPNLSPLKRGIIDTEKRFQLPIKRPEFIFDYYDLVKKEQIQGFFEMRGTVDLVMEVDDNTIEVLDYKTGKRKCWTTGVDKDVAYLSEKDIQLRMYDLALSLVYPQYKYRLLTIYFMNDGGPFTVSFSDEQREETYQMILDHYKHAKKNKIPTRLMEEKPNETWKCKKVCSFGKNVNMNGISVCDRIYNSILTRGMDQTILDVNEIRSKKQVEQDTSVSNRRNVY